MTTPRMLDCRAVQDLIGASKSTIYALIRRGSFPRPVQTGVRAVRWYEAEVLEWLAARPRAGTERPPA